MAKVVQLTIDDETFTTDDLTVDEAIQVEQETGQSWLHMQPGVSAVQTKAVLVAWLSRTTARDVAAKRVGAMTVAEIADVVKIVESDLPGEYIDGQVNPKAGGAPSTSGSSGAPDDSDGPRP